LENWFLKVLSEEFYGIKLKKSIKNSSEVVKKNILLRIIMFLNGYY